MRNADNPKHSSKNLERCSRVAEPRPPRPWSGTKKTKEKHNIQLHRQLRGWFMASNFYQVFGDFFVKLWSCFT